MGIEMHSWILIFLVVPYSYEIEMRETEYECGAHGRFEYCIDGVPGCVIGCHCHPGYYFDTDTKICEPNIRLSQNFRRNYNYDVLEPTRVFLPPTPPIIEEPATTVKNPVDEKIDIITKDADDLGDWLYNQFFKTIENQVINETKDDSVITRRSENAPTFIRKPTRRSHRYWKARRKKKKKKKGLKSKLLRITEDDSLFDSSSGSSSDESSNSGSSSASEESHEKVKKIKSDHGHKKIVVFNKRPKPPLPSFIFLPNMETPFFPPIGLPPPPMPMYPMVPVPPMMGAFPFPAPNPPCETATNKTNGNTGNNASTQPSQTKTPNENPPNDKPPDENPPNDKPPDENPSNDNPPDENPSSDNPPDGNPPNDNAPDENPSNDNPTDKTDPDEVNPTDTPPSDLRARTKKRRGPRKKLVQKLRENLKRKNKLHNYFANAYQGPPIDPPGFRANHLPNMRHKPLPEINVEEEFAALQDVDFKYLSQLIHRADLNKINQSRTTTTTPSAQIKNVLTVPPPSRRNYYDSYPEQITQVLNNLANQPINHISENQPTYDSPNQPTYNEPNRRTYNTANQLSYNVPNQPTYNVPYQSNYNAPNNPNNNAPNQPTYNAPNQPTYIVPNQSSYDVPKQPTYNVANQPTYVSLNRPSHKIPYRKKIEDTNDFYYANLGRQIASMIRNIEGDKEVDIEIKSNPNIPNNPVLTGHSGSRSYWERSVRSPYTHIINTLKKQINSLKSSNEDLFYLENRVEIAASTEPTLSLHELENIISKMQKAKSKFIRRNGSSRRATQSSKSSFNVNLLPGNHQQFHSNGKLNKRTQNIKSKPSKPNNLLKSAKQSTGKQNFHGPLQPAPIRSSLLTDFMFTLQADEILDETTPKTSTYQTNTYVSNVTPTSKPDPVVAPQFIYKMPNPHFKPYAYTVPPKPPLNSNMQPTTRRTYYQQLSPMVLNHKAVKYYDGINNSQYLFEKASIPLSLPQSFSPMRIAAPVTRYENFGKRIEPSYFHHEVHHFDYFDDLL